ncbi:uncharacterized protein JCM6883_004860 [Sporobolomyces salmoneus]|uniref:uncharacterized protein n=1 Tax=Sporobolomyces salmoneus TaxID=183962 RepID=UPI003174489D
MRGGVMQGTHRSQAGSHPRDRLSSLPNELLYDIFSLSYDRETPSTGAPSKRLLPFHIFGLYRDILLEKEENIRKLVDIVGSNPDLGKRIESLSLCTLSYDTVGEGIGSSIQINQFLRNLPNLKSFDLGDDDHDLSGHFLYATSAPILPSLVHLRVANPSENYEFPFDIFCSFPGLTKLEIVRLDLDYHPSLPLFARPLSNLTHLSVTGANAGESEIVSLCRLCPNLTHLHLDASQPDYTEILRVVPSTLIELRLNRDGVPGNEYVDHQLSRFTQLKHLELGFSLFSDNVGTYLAQHRNLETIRLGEGEIRDVGPFRDLVSGRNRLPNLRRIDLDLTEAQIGYRISLDEDGTLGGRWIPGDGRLIAGDWTLPWWFDSREHIADQSEELIAMAKAEGIEVAGQVLNALRIRESYQLEIANIAVYRSFRDHDTSHIKRLRLEHPSLCKRLPSLDLRTLDPTRLVLVKIDLHEEDWFQLTLEN